MDVFTVYILFSKKHAKTYLGYTSNLLARFYSHNSLANKGYTIKFRPWEVIHCEVYYTKSEAIKREKFLKSGKGREYTKQIMRDLGLISA